jgi:hypothetical protein
MTSNVIPFRNPRDPDLPSVGAERLAARRAYREGCKLLAEYFVAQAFSAAGKMPGIGRLGCDDALPVFVAAMRRELRKSGLF